MSKRSDDVRYLGGARWIGFGTDEQFERLLIPIVHMLARQAAREDHESALAAARSEAETKKEWVFSKRRGRDWLWV